MGEFITLCFACADYCDQRVWFDLVLSSKVTAEELYARVVQSVNPITYPEVYLVHAGKLIPRTTPPAAPLSVESARTLVQELSLRNQCWISVQSKPPAAAAVPPPPPPPAAAEVRHPERDTDQAEQRPGTRRRRTCQ